MSLPSSLESREQVAKLGYLPALDGLRALAIVAVLLYHTGGLMPGGTVGVDLFFVLSGFLITTLLLEEMSSTGSLSLRRFYRRRVTRLLPALFVVLAAFLLAAMLVAVVEQGSLGKDLFGVVAGIGYFSNVAMTAEPTTMSMPAELRHLWSLAAEEQFYLVWPAVLVFVLRGRVRLALIVVTAGAVLMSARQFQLYADGASWERIGFGIDTRNVSILVGCMLALLLALPGRPRLEKAAWLAPPAGACVIAFFFVDFGRQLFAGPLIVYAISCAVLILGVLDGRSPLARVLSLGPIVFVGRISYSLYLWHFPVFVILDVNRPGVVPAAVPAIALTVMLAVASYYLIELPFLRRKPQPRVPNRRSTEKPPASDALSHAA
ncbi:MAG: acyltransferase family protein [Gaiellaceae bacterium]